MFWKCKDNAGTFRARDSVTHHDGLNAALWTVQLLLSKKDTPTLEIKMEDLFSSSRVGTDQAGSLVPPPLGSQALLLALLSIVICQKCLALPVILVANPIGHTRPTSIPTMNASADGWARARVSWHRTLWPLASVHCLRVHKRRTDKI